MPGVGHRRANFFGCHHALRRPSHEPAGGPCEGEKEERWVQSCTLTVEFPFTFPRDSEGGRPLCSGDFTHFCSREGGVPAPTNLLPDSFMRAPTPDFSFWNQPTMFVAFWGDPSLSCSSTLPPVRLHQNLEEKHYFYYAVL